MTDTNTQTVAETKVPAQPETAAAGAQTDDLATVLNEFETETRTQTPEPKQAPVPPEFAQRIEALEKTISETKFKEEFQPILKRIRGDIPDSVLSDAEITDLLDGRAKRDPKLQNAYLNRQANPAAWAKVEKMLGAEISGKFSKLPDPDATSDKEAVAAAVRGASTKAPPEKPPNLGQLSNPEYRKKVKEDWGFDPGV